GAREAGVIHFMDQSFGSIMQDSLAMARAGLADFQSGIPGAHPGARVFSDLDPVDQDAYLNERENSQFFNFMRFMTLAGFFSMSSYGGNRDQIAWKLIGFEHGGHGWQPPFGWYDAEHLQSEDAGD
ncbi:MAG TPA: gluconate 2-dehydrogenase subunit 3 family protein, partial [Woeseiaceae bacterium]|nr:gluconate 2-dehydrogenase subunit 3 family protein [Woeseiaceae bacterium]